MKNVKVKQDLDPKFKPLLTRIKERVLNMTRSTEKGIVNQTSKSSFAMRDNGDINTVSSKFAQSKLSAEGRTTDVSTQSNLITNTEKKTVEEQIVNNHKFNNLLYEYTDPKMVFNDPEKIVTGLSLQSTILTKSWDHHLQRYVLIRRPARFAMYSPELNLAEVPEELGLEDKLKTEFDEMFEIESAASKFEEATRME